MTRPLAVRAAELELRAACDRMNLGPGDALWVLLVEYNLLRTRENPSWSWPTLAEVYPDRATHAAGDES